MNSRTDGLMGGGRRGAFLLVFLGLAAAVVQGADLPPPIRVAWETSTPMPEARDGYAVGVFGGRMYLAGGTYWDGSKGNWIGKRYSAAVHSFDPRTGRWEKLPDAPRTLGYVASAQVGGDAYVISGLQDGHETGDVLVFRRRGDGIEWSEGPALPETRLFAAAVSIGPRIYVVGGTRKFEPFDEKGHCCTSKTSTNSVWMLDTGHVSRGWRRLAGYPGPCRWLQITATDGRSIFMFGGIHIQAREKPVVNFNEVLRYDIAADRWERIGDMPEALQNAPAVPVDGGFVLIGRQKDVMLFEPGTARFTRLASLPEAAMVSDFVWIAPYLVGAGGENEQEGPRRRSDTTFLGRVTVLDKHGSSS